MREDRLVIANNKICCYVREKFGRIDSGKPLLESMRRPEIVSSGRIRAARAHWRPFVLGMLIVFTVTAVCGLYLHGSHQGEHAAIAMGWTLVGMLALAYWVCRR